MELRHLKYFTAVAEDLHFGRAAARLNIAAPTLSHQISALETQLGAKLFTRRTKSAVALTQLGTRFLVEAYATLKQAAHAELIGRRAARGDIGSVDIGYMFASGCGGIASSAVLGFRKKHPGITTQLRLAQTFAQFRALTESALDVGFTAAPQTYPTGLAGFVVERCPFMLAIPEKHPLATRKRITPAMLTNEPFIALSLEMEVGFGGGAIAAVTPPGVSLNVVERATDILSVLVLVAGGVGLSVVWQPMSNIGVPGIVFRPVAGVTRTAAMALTYRKNESSPAVKAFIDFMRPRALDA